MTVSELIEQLQQYPQSAEVMVHSLGQGLISSINGIRVDRLYQDGRQVETKPHEAKSLRIIIT